MPRPSATPHRLTLSATRFLAALALSTLVTACNDGSSDAPATEVAAPVVVPPVVQPVTTPTAAFTASATGTVQGPIAFDASASTSTDGGALQYVWDFGDGVRGGGAKIAHAFAAGGTRSVTLTVIDTSGRQGKVTRGVEVAAAAAAVGTVTVHAAVVDAEGAALAGVGIARPGATTPLGTTDAMGLVDITLDKGPLLVLHLTKPGYADQTSPVQLPAGAGTDTRIDAVMRTRDAGQSLADAHVGGTLTGRAGATITLPADALVTAAGTLATGAVSISMTTVDPTLAGGGGFPGRFDGVTPDGTTTPIVSFGSVEFVLGDAASRLQLAPGKTATIELPVMANRKLDGSAVAVGDVIPLWSLDETTGLWIQEGTGTVVANSGAATGLAMRSVVSHFSWWNTDLGFDPYGPQPDCQAAGDIGIPEARDSFNTATICNMLAEIDRTLGSGGAVPSASRARPLAATVVNPLVAGFARRTSVPIGGGQSIAVPSNTNIALSATALNGTWAGRVVVNGPVLKQERVLIEMRPLQVAGQTTEALNLPVTNLVRAIVSGRTGRFSFSAGELQYAKFQVFANNGSSVSGSARLLQGTTVLASAPFSSFTGTVANLLIGLPSAGNYLLEIVTEQSGGVVVNGELLGGVQSETVGFPADVTRAIPVYGAYRATFDLPAAATVHFAAKSSVPVATGEIRLTGPAGNVLWSRSNVGNVNPEMIELALPAGRYLFTFSRSDINVTTLRFTSEVTDWLPVAAGDTVDDIYSVLDLVADRNGRPVVGVLRHPVVNQTLSSSVQLRRFNGTGWEDVGGPITTSPLACGNHTTSFAFDSSNTPTIVYTSRTAFDVYSAAARRLVGGVWQAIGPNDGVLPQSGEGCDDARAPRLVIDAADRPVVAYRGDAKVLVQRFDGTAWSKLATTAQDSFPNVYSAHDLARDPAGTLWLVLKGESTTVARRFDVASGTWLTVGPNGGVLPESNTAGFSIVRVGFDTGGRPVIGGTVGVYDSTRATFSTGAAVYRFDGTNWLTTGGYQLPGSYVNNTQVPGFAVLGNDVLLSWLNQYGPGNAAGVVQRNTPAGWSGFGVGADGTLAAYTTHAATPLRPLIDSHLLVVGNDVYLAGVAAVLSSSSANSTLNIVLLKKTP